MRGSHVGHDNVIGNGVTVGCNSVLAGYVRIMDGANLGISVCVILYGQAGSLIEFERLRLDAPKPGSKAGFADGV